MNNLKDISTLQDTCALGGTNNPRKITKEFLPIVQVLSQNYVISEEEKEEILRLLKDSFKTNDLSCLNEYLKRLSKKDFCI